MVGSSNLKAHGLTVLYYLNFDLMPRSIPSLFFNRKNQFLSLIIIPRVVHFKWSLKLIFSWQHCPCPCLALSVPNHFTFNPSIWKAFCLSVFLPSKTDLNTDVTSVYLLQLTIFVQIVNRNLLTFRLGLRYLQATPQVGLAQMASTKFFCSNQLSHCNFVSFNF